MRLPRSAAATASSAFLLLFAFLLSPLAAPQSTPPGSGGGPGQGSSPPPPGPQGEFDDAIPVDILVGIDDGSFTSQDTAAYQLEVRYRSRWGCWGYLLLEGHLNELTSNSDDRQLLIDRYPFLEREAPTDLGSRFGINGLNDLTGPEGFFWAITGLPLDTPLDGDRVKSFFQPNVKDGSPDSRSDRNWDPLASVWTTHPPEGPGPDMTDVWKDVIADDGSSPTEMDAAALWEWAICLEGGAAAQDFFTAECDWREGLTMLDVAWDVGLELTVQVIVLRSTILLDDYVTDDEDTTPGLVDLSVGAGLELGLSLGLDVAILTIAPAGDPPPPPPPGPVGVIIRESGPFSASAGQSLDLLMHGRTHLDSFLLLTMSDGAHYSLPISFAGPGVGRVTIPNHPGTGVFEGGSNYFGQYLDPMASIVHPLEIVP